jgi:feruloyl esterase
VAASCASLTGTKVPDTTFNAAEEVTSGSFVPPSGAAIADLPSFCRLAATIKPTAESDIKVELWMPKAWNGKYLGTGNGGMAGKIDYEALANGVRRGYAVANTDLGTSGGIETMVGRMEKIVDFGHRATHLMTNRLESGREGVLCDGAEPLVFPWVLHGRRAGHARGAKVSRGL